MEFILWLITFFILTYIVDQQSKIIYQTKEPISQNKPVDFPPMDSDDEDSEDEDSSEDVGIVRHLPIYVFICYNRVQTLHELKFMLSAGFQNTPLTPPDLVV